MKISNEPQYFTPYIVGMFDDESQFDFNDNSNEKELFRNDDGQDPDSASRVTSMSHTVLAMSHVGGEAGYKEALGIKSKTENMQMTLGIMSVERVVIDTKNVEQTIEKDFIDSTVLKE